MGLYNFIPQFLKKKIQLYLIGPNVGPYPQHHFSQGGEDITLIQILKGYNLFKKTGFFVDVGAFHPYSDSNTFTLYNMGWRGINIDARPNSMIAFNKYRPEDINLEIGISKQESVLDFYLKY